MDLVKNHYRALLDDHGHESIDFSLRGLSENHLRYKFVSAQNGSAFASNLDAPSLVTTGIGMTGTPHVGTVGQITAAIALQRAGFDVQLVLADLEAYNWSGRGLEYARTLAETYREFALELGFDPDEGILRTQEEAREVMHTSQILSKRFEPSADLGSGTETPTEFEEKLSAKYAESGSKSDTTDFSDDQGAMLLVSDILHPVLKDGYENVLLMLGADGHGFIRTIRRVLDRTDYSATLASIHTRMVAGLGDYPKMSKSLPASKVSTDLPADEIREGILGLEPDDADPEDSPIFTMMCLASLYSEEKLDRLAEQCEQGGEAWDAATHEYADLFVEYADAWKAVAPPELGDWAKQHG